MKLSEAYVEQVMNRRISLGEAFLSQKDLVLVEGHGGKDKFTVGDLREEGAFEGLPPLRRAHTAMMVKNLWERIQSLDETTRMLSIGDFDKFAYPMVTIVYPNLVAHELVSVQPMDGPTSLIFYLNATYGNAKAPTVAGDNIITTPNADYASEQVVGEQVATGSAVTGVGPYTGSFAWIPVRPGTISITDGLETFTDDGAGVLTGNLTGTGTIDYSTGAFSITFNGAPGAGVAILATYSMDLEGNPLVPEMDISLQQSPVTARPMKLRARWSMEGAYNLKKLHGMEAEVELVAACTNELKFEIDQRIINNLWAGTVATEPVWSSTPGAGVSYAEHQLSFVKSLNQSSNRIFTNSGRAVGEWCVGGMNVMNIVEVLPGGQRLREYIDVLAFASEAQNREQ